MSPMNSAQSMPHEVLTADAYRQLEHAASLKGLLKPFKGKGELVQLTNVTRELEQRVAQLMGTQAAIMALPPLSLLGIRLVLQNTGAGTTFLRWRTQDFSRMGALVWERLMRNPRLPPDLRTALFQLECNRIALNLQMSVLHSLQRQALDCSHKMANAEGVLRQSPSGTETLP